MTIGELKKYLIQKLSDAVGISEAQAMTRVIFEDVIGVDWVSTAVNPDRAIEDETLRKVDEVANEVLNGRPLQYVIGSAMFQGMRFTVNPSVLIPRPETSGLVDWIVDTLESAKDLSIIDVGTGSGAIAIALARRLPYSCVTAIDISQQALDIANVNIRNLKASNVKTRQWDILTNSFPQGMYDVVVSNPPYVLESEKANMDARVLDYEPATALFVPDGNPILFYRAIAEAALKQLNPKGWVFFEINPSQVKNLVTLMESLGFDEVEAQRDFAGRYRYLKARKNS